jgi:SWI/SNF-related matrix-associated actin-dependent regulator 1 of chromatin subfamily A
VSVTKNGQFLKLNFRYKREAVELIKTIPGRKYIPTTKTWIVPATNEGIENVLKLPGVRILASSLSYIQGLLETPLKRAYTSPQGCFKPGSQPIIKPIEINLPEGLELLPFQKEGIEFIESRNGRALIGDEMGLGKTIQALGWLRIHPEFRPAVLIVPSSLKINWGKEATKWLDKNDNIEILSGRPSESNQILNITTIIIVNYDILFDNIEKETKKLIQPGWWSVLKSLNPSVLILDESTFIKSNIARRTKAVQALADSNNLESAIPHVIALSGTPILNRPIEFYNIISLIDPKLFPNWWKFTTRYCGRFQKDIYVKGGKKRRVSDFTGATNVDELNSILISSIMIRRLKRDVLQDLPDKIRSVVPLEINNRKEYEEAETDFISWLTKKEGVAVANKAEKAQTLVKLGKLQQLSMRGKLKPAINWIHGVIDNEEKLVVFVTRHETADELMTEFGELAVRFTGKETLEERQEAVDKFQNDENILLFVGMIDNQGQPAGVGITLVASSYVAFIGFPWSPAILCQGEDRCHRIGTKNAVNIYYLIAEKTIEEDHIELLMNKEKVLNAILDGVPLEETSIIEDLLNKYRNREV